MVSKSPYGKLELTEAMCVGCPAIDDEHRDLIEIINNIAGAYDDSKFENCKGHIRHFTDSMKKHFRREEEILEELGFSRLDEHRKHHLAIESDIEAISQDLGDDISDRQAWGTFYQKLISVAVDDAVKADMDFKSFLMEKNRWSGSI